MSPSQVRHPAIQVNAASGGHWRTRLSTGRTRPHCRVLQHLRAHQRKGHDQVWPVPYQGSSLRQRSPSTIPARSGRREDAHRSHRIKGINRSNSPALMGSFEGRYWPGGTRPRIQPGHYQAGSRPVTTPGERGLEQQRTHSDLTGETGGQEKLLRPQEPDPHVLLRTSIIIRNTQDQVLFC